MKSETRKTRAGGFSFPTRRKLLCQLDCKSLNWHHPATRKRIINVKSERGPCEHLSSFEMCFFFHPPWLVKKSLRRFCSTTNFPRKSESTEVYFVSTLALLRQWKRINSSRLFDDFDSFSHRKTAFMWANVRMGDDGNVGFKVPRISFCTKLPQFIKINFHETRDHELLMSRLWTWTVEIALRTLKMKLC